MRIYLDNCCFNRPYDDQSLARIRIEAEAKVLIQDRVRSGEIELAWSYILEHENYANPFTERRAAIKLWKNLAVVDVVETAELLDKARYLRSYGLKPADSLHVASAMIGNCQWFLSTDNRILKLSRSFTGIGICDPPTFVRGLL